jgi:hypothetical protein
MRTLHLSLTNFLQVLPMTPPADSYIQFTASKTTAAAPNAQKNEVHMVPSAAAEDGGELQSQKLVDQTAERV